jgi:hypothetical protein
VRLWRLRIWLIKLLAGKDAFLIGFARLNLPPGKIGVWVDNPRRSCYIGCDIVRHEAADWQELRAVLEAD